jgi:hypothetical protein
MAAAYHGPVSSVSIFLSVGQMALKLTFSPK